MAILQTPGTHDAAVDDTEEQNFPCSRDVRVYKGGFAIPAMHAICALSWALRGEMTHRGAALVTRGRELLIRVE